MMTVAVLIFSLVGIIIGNRSFAYQDNKDSVWNIYFDNMKTSIINGNAFVPNDPEVEATRIKAYDVLISKKGDYATFTFDVVNDGTLDAKLSTLTKLDPKCISLEIPENTYDEEFRQLAENCTLREVDAYRETLSASERLNHLVWPEYYTVSGLSMMYPPETDYSTVIKDMQQWMSDRIQYLDRKYENWTR